MTHIHQHELNEFPNMSGPISGALIALQDRLLEGMRVHTKAATSGPAGYPERNVPLDKIDRAVSYPDYAPVPYTSPVVLKFAPDGSPIFPKWADAPEVANLRTGKNPGGRTGITGRGLLGKFEANYAADPIVLAFDEESGKVYLIAIERDSGDWAIPGGMVENGQSKLTTALRELSEETNVDLEMSDALEGYAGYVDDWRNTDDAWMETNAFIKVISWPDMQKLELKALDKAEKIKQVKRLELEPAVLNQLYASHGTFVRLALISLLLERPCCVPATALSKVSELIGL